MKHRESHRISSGISTSKLVLASFLLYQTLGNIPLKAESKHATITTHFHKNTKEYSNKVHQEAVKIRNFNQLTEEQKEYIFEHISYWEGIFKEKQIPEWYKIPLELVRIAKENEIQIAYKRGNINYIPNVDIAYQLVLEYYENIKIYGEEFVPQPRLIVGMFSQESSMRPFIPGGIGQLHIGSAKEFAKDDEVFQSYYTVNENDSTIQFLGSTNEEKIYNMIKCAYRCLIKEKQFSQKKAQRTFQKYNGSIKEEDACKYAIPVLENGIKFGIAMATYKPLQEQQKMIKELANTIKDNHLEHFSIEKDTKVLEEYIYAVVSKMIEIVHNKKTQNISLPNESKIPIAQMPHTYYTTPIDINGKGPLYIIKNEGKSVFSYFRKNLREALKYHNTTVNNNPKRAIYLYYYTYDSVHQKRNLVYIDMNKETDQELQNVQKKGYTVYSYSKSEKIYIKNNSQLYTYREGEEDTLSIFEESQEEQKQKL